MRAQKPIYNLNLFLCAGMFFSWMCTFTPCVCAFVHAYVLMKIYLLVSWCLMSLSLKLDRDPSISWGDIQLFVTLNNLENNKKAMFCIQIHTGGILTFWNTFFHMFLPILGTLPLIERTQKDSCFFLKNELRRTSGLNMIWWHSANRDVLPGRFQSHGDL